MLTLGPVQVSELPQSTQSVPVVVVVQVPAVQEVAVDVICCPTSFSIKANSLRSPSKQMVFFDIKLKNESFSGLVFFWSFALCQILDTAFHHSYSLSVTHKEHKQYL